MSRDKKRAIKKEPRLPPAAGNEQVASLRQLVQEKGETALPELEAAARGSDRDLAVAALEILGTLRLPAAADLLARLSIDLQEPRLAKLARRGLYYLSQIGIRPQATPSPLVTIRPPEAERLVHSLAGVYDAKGNRPVIVVRANRLDAYRLAVFMLNDRTGIKDTDGYSYISRRRSEDIVATYRGRGKPLFLYEVPLAYCRRVVDEARRLNEASGTPLPEGFERWYDILDGQASEPLPLPQELSPEGIRAESGLLEVPDDLFGLGRGWLLWFEPKELEPYGMRMINMATVIPETIDGLPNLSLIRTEAATITEAIQGTMTEERRGLLKKRLADMAELLWYTGFQEKARQMMAASLALGPDSGIPVEEHPLLRAIIRDLLRELVETAQKESKETEEEEEGEEILGGHYIWDRSGLLLPK